MIPNVDLCRGYVFAALVDDLFRCHYLHQDKGVCPKDDSYSLSIMKYSNVITYRKKELTVRSTEIQGNFYQNRKPTALVAKHKIAHFVVSNQTVIRICIVFEPDFLSWYAFITFFFTYFE